ncbi:amidase [Rhodococcus sp. ABRD24]|uniref:amidase family protein n=1 Tax=Rhodococcus sp. ABRD24 TaxID=2507582 RepID=UPI00103CF60C|nr:amidase family protein [Rhodococcus sp. ABRD24]QBJ97824.1 amidase [Rhodococcus sp. ABRD24]
MPTGPNHPRLDRRSFLRAGVALGGVALLTGCGEALHDPGVPPLPGGDTAPADKATWRVQSDPLSAATGQGALDGLSVAVTDLFAMRGQQIGAGNPRWLAQARTEPVTAAAVSRLLTHGAAITGLAQTVDFGFGHAGTNSHYGTPANAAAVGRIPGGATSGATTAVARGTADIGLGPDTSGSIRIPAAFQGLYGFTATRGFVPTDGLMPLSPTLDSIGWVCAGAATLAAVGDALLPSTSETGFDSAVIAPGLLSVADDRVQASMQAAVTGWRRSSLPRLTESDLDIADLPDWHDAVIAVQGYEAWLQHGDWLSTATGALGDEARENFLAAAQVSEPTYRRRLTQLESAAETVRAFVGSRLLILPTTSSPAPLSSNDPGGTRISAMLRVTGMLTSVATVAGLPTATVPLTSPDGPPVGLSLIGPSGRDRDVLAVAQRVATTSIASRTSN